MAASRGWEGPPPGSQPTLSGSKTVFLKSIGTFCRTRRPRPNLSAAFPCLATHSPGDSRKQCDRPEGVRHHSQQIKEELAMISPDALNATYVILGASGNTGSIIADSLLSKGKKVRVVGRDAERLQRSVRQGAEAFMGEVSDAAALTKAFSGARAALDVAADYLPGRPRARERCDCEGRNGVRPAVRSALEQLRRSCPGRHRASHGAAFFGAKTERDRRFERPAPARRVFHGEQSGGDQHDSGDGDLRTCTATRPEDAHDRDARCGRLRREAPPGPKFFRQTNLRTAWRARPVDGGSHRDHCARHWQTRSALRAVSLRQGAGGVRANGDAAEESRGVYRDVPGDQRRCPRCAGAAFAGEHHADFV